MPLDIIHRYKPIIDLLAHEQCSHHARVILEVGSGNGGVAQYVSDMPIINYDVNFTGQRLRHVRYVRGSANQLPFKDKSCSWVVSVDMLEHIAEEKRHEAIRELLRVSKHGMILAFPDGKKVRPYERAFQALYRLSGSRHVWLEDHLTYATPEATQVVDYITDIVSVKCNVRVIKNVNLVVWFLSMIVSLPLLMLSKLCKISLKTYMCLFGWTTHVVSFGECYRAIVVCEKL